MPVLSRLTAVLTVAAMLGTLQLPLEARNKKGDRLIAEGQQREARKDYDAALELYEQALSADPSDAGYQLAVDRARFQASMMHINQGLKLRDQGSLDQALLNFQKAYAIDPASSVAVQEIRQTQEMIAREKKKAEEAPNAVRTPAQRGMTPVEEAKKEAEERLSRILPVPELRPLNPQRINLKMNNQPPKVLYETVGKLAGINVLFDPEFTAAKNQSIELTNATLEQALDYLSVVTKSFWKALSPNTIFVANDNTTKRRDYEEQVMKVFYLTNVNTPQELQEIVTAVRSVADIQRLFVYNAQNAIIARGEADKIALAEKIINDLDKPKSEVVVDVVVMEVSSAYSRNLAAALAPSGLKVPILFSPRAGITTGTTTTSSGTGTDSGTGTGTGTGTATTASTAIPLANLGKISSHDYSLVLPDGLLQAIMSDSGTRVLQSPELRSVDNQKASLKIGDRRPTATGSFQPGIGGVGINPLVNTQFTYIDVGVNVDVTPRVHEDGEVSLHVSIEVSKVTGNVNLGGIDQPIIGQRKIDHEIRLKDGEVNLLGGLTQVQETKTVTGIPGLSSIPIVRRLFTGETVEKSNNDLLIALVPHVVRRPSITPENIRSIAVGNATVVKLNYAPENPAQPAAPPQEGAAAQNPPVVTPSTSQPPAAAPPATAPLQPPATAPAPAPKPEATAPQSNAAVRFVPDRVNTILGSTVNVNLVIDNATDLAAAPAQIKFDPKILRLDAIERGDFLSRDGQQVIFTMNIRNDAGEASVNLNRMPNTSGVSGGGVLMTLRFQTVGRGAATISAPQFTPRNQQGQALLTTTPLTVVNVQ